MFTKKYQATYPELLRMSLISYYKEFCYAEYFLSTHVRYRYHIVIERYFQRVGTDDILAYKIPNRPICYEDYFLIKENLYSKDVNKILLELNLAHYEECTL